MKKSIAFNRKRADAIRKSIELNQPIAPYGKEWTYEDALHLLAVSSSGVFSRLIDRLSKGQPFEHREAIAQEINRDFNTIVNHLAITGLCLNSDKYAEWYDDKLVVVIDNKQVEPISGLRKKELVFKGV